MQIYIRYRLEHFVSVNTHILTACWCTLPVVYTCRSPFLRPCWSWLPAGHSLCFSLRMVMDFFADAPALVLFYYFPQMASLSCYFLMYSPKRRTFLSLSERVPAAFYYMMTSFTCGFIGKWLWLVFQRTPRKLFHRELQQLPLVQTRSVQGIALFLASLSHVLLWEALGEGHLFSSGWQQPLRNVHHKCLFCSWSALWLRESWWRSTGIAAPICGQNMQVYLKDTLRCKGKKTNSSG